MSTRCVIGYRTPEDQVIYSYCHFDGYPSGVGAKLIARYNTEEAARQIASLHGFSSLEDTFEATKEEEYDDGGTLYGVMPYQQWRHTVDLFGCDYTYIWQCGGWFFTPQFSYDLQEVIDRDAAEDY